VLPWKGALTVYGTNVRNLEIYQNTVTMARSPGGEGTVVLLRPGNTDVTFRNNLLVADDDPLVSADADLPTTRALFQGCPREGLDLRALFHVDPGAEDFFGRALSTPPVVGAAQR
jgi:hypothetical protein